MEAVFQISGAFSVAVIGGSVILMMWDAWVG